MNKKEMKRPISPGKVVLTVAAVCLVLAATSSVVYAATTQATGNVSVRPTTVLDPFALKIITVSTTSSTTQSATNPTAFAANTPRGRSTVRIPAKAPLRTAFHPIL